jgi:hypothetical protein
MKNLDPSVWTTDLRMTGDIVLKSPLPPFYKEGIVLLGPFAKREKKRY